MQKNDALTSQPWYQDYLRFVQLKHVGTGKTAVMALHPHELIRRWLIHALPKGFARVRHYGFMSSAACRTLETIRLHLGTDPKPAPQLPEAKPHTCPCCGGNLTFLRELAPIRLMRGPPKKPRRQPA